MKMNLEAEEVRLGIRIAQGLDLARSRGAAAKTGCSVGARPVMCTLRTVQVVISSAGGVSAGYWPKKQHLPNRKGGEV